MTEKLQKKITKEGSYYYKKSRPARAAVESRLFAKYCPKAPHNTTEYITSQFNLSYSTFQQLAHLLLINLSSVMFMSRETTDDIKCNRLYSLLCDRPLRDIISINNGIRMAP